MTVNNSGISLRLFLRANWWLLFFTLILFTIGVFNLYSACAVRYEGGFIFSGEYKKQIIWGTCGLGIMALLFSFDYRHLKTLSWPLFVLVVFLLVLVLFTGKVAGGAQRWIPLGFFNLQPSELAKASTLILGASVLSAGKDPLGFIDIFKVSLVGLIPACLTLVQPDLGTCLNILLILGGMILYRGIKTHVLVAGLVLLLLSPLAVWIGIPYLKPYQQQRIMTFIDPDNAPKDAVHNILQARIAIGSGQVAGNGYMGGGQSKLGYLPVGKTDFALAVFGEEWGFIGCLTLVSLFSLFMLAILSTARNAKDRFGSMLCAGVFFYFFWQIFINMGMVMGLMPVVGIPLPFISYGGTTTLINFAQIGILLNVSMRRFLFKMKL